MIISTSGGLVYHARALRAVLAGDLWKDTRTLASFCASHWLRRLNPERLVCVGPSAGYLLNESALQWLTHLSNMQTLILAEPDPFARFVFRQRILKASKQRSPDTVTPSPGQTTSTSKARQDGSAHRARHFKLQSEPDFLEKWVEQCSSSQPADPQFTLTARDAILFWGCLGQRMQTGTLTPQTFRKRIRQKLMATPTPWASLHDRFSFTNSSNHFNGAPTEVIDHETDWIANLSPSVPIPIAWPLTQNRLHWLEWVQSNSI